MWGGYQGGYHIYICVPRGFSHFGLNKRWDVVYMLQSSWSCPLWWWYWSRIFVLPISYEWEFIRCLSDLFLGEWVAPSLGYAWLQELSCSLFLGRLGLRQLEKVKKIRQPAEPTFLSHHVTPHHTGWSQCDHSMMEDISCFGVVDSSLCISLRPLHEDPLTQGPKALISV